MTSLKRIRSDKRLTGWHSTPSTVYTTPLSCLCYYMPQTPGPYCLLMWGLWMLSTRIVWDSCLESDGTIESSLKWWTEMLKYFSGPVSLHCPISYLVYALLIWACGSTWRRHTGKHGSAAPRKPITQPIAWPHVASPTWSSTEQVVRPATKWLYPSGWRPLEACSRSWTWWCNDATALAGYANMMMIQL